MNQKYYFFSLIFLSFVISIISCHLFETYSSQRQGPASDLLLQAILQEKILCSKDSDCVLVDKDCCSCNNKGESIAIHHSQESDYNNQLKRVCSTQQQDFSCQPWDRCKDFRAKCHNSQCFTSSVVR